MNTIKINKEHVQMIAHRGLSGLEKENTCAAFVAAGKPLWSDFVNQGIN